MDTSAANDAFHEVQTLGPWLLLTLTLFGLGIFLHRIPKFPNGLIPLALMAIGAVLYSQIGPLASVDPTKFRHPAIVLGLQGSLLGLVAWCGKDAILSRIGKFLPEGFQVQPKDTDKPQEPPKTP